MKKTTTYGKMIFLFFCIVIPLFAFSALFVHHNNSQMKQQTLKALQDKTSSVATVLSDKLDQLYLTAVEFSGQSNLNRLASTSQIMTPYEISLNVNTIRDQQESLKNANVYIENLAIYYQKLGKVYNSNTSLPSLDLSNEEFQTLWNVDTYSNFLTVTDKQLTGIVHPINNAHFLIEIRFNMEAFIQHILDMFSDYQVYYSVEFFDLTYQNTNIPEDSLSLFNKKLHAGLDSESTFPHLITLGDQSYYVFSSNIYHTISELHLIISEEQCLKNDHTNNLILLLFCIVILLVTFIYLWSSYNMVHKPIHILINAFHKINTQDYQVHIQESNSTDFSILYREFNHMVQKLKQLIENEYQQQLLINKAELKQLQAQINPHFLYNSLFLLRHMISDQLYDEALETADRLGQYFRYITRNSQDYMPLSQEYQHALLYCEIQQLRFDGRIRIELPPLREEYRHVLVPKLIIQPLLENAFNHGLQNVSVDGILKMDIVYQDSGLTISVEDNGNNLSDEQLNILQNNLLSVLDGNPQIETTGILNIQRRLHIYSNKTSYLTVTRSSLGGLCIQLHISIR